VVLVLPLLVLLELHEEAKRQQKSLLNDKKIIEYTASDSCTLFK
jgi:hypothetical protein